MTTKNSNTPIYLLLVLQQLIASGTHIVASSLTQEVEPKVALFFRSIIVCIAFTIFFLLQKKQIKRIEKSDYFTLVIMGLLNIPLNQYLFLSALEKTSPPNVALAYSLLPAFVLIIAAMFLGEKLRLVKTIGIILAIGGTIILIAQKGFDFSSTSFQGDLLALTASLSWAIYTIVGKRFSQKYGGIYATGLAMFMGTILYQPIFFAQSPEINFELISTKNWLQLLYIGAITSGLGYAIWYYALTKIEAGRVAVFNNVQPVFVTILALIFLDQQLSTDFFIGGSLIIGGIYLTQRY
ncbi:DMT family transporter [Candidatus Kapabacteria bacterium]|nr:DMT family transporter [Candidatus Kapabacteria bacterium]